MRPSWRGAAGAARTSSRILALEITSSLDIGLDAQLAFLDRVRSEPAARAPYRLPVLPGMAEGWGEGHAG